MLSKNGTSEAAARISSARFDDTAFKLKKRQLMRERGFPEDELPFPEMAAEEGQPLILPVIDTIVRTCINDIAAVAEVSPAVANGLISRSLARIHFAAQDAKPA